MVTFPPPPPCPNKLCVSVRSEISAGIVGAPCSSLYCNVNGVPAILNVCVCTELTPTRLEFVRSRLSLTGNSFILLPSVVSTIKGILFAILII